jgi:acyl-CoA synthetase (NDP forming)/RimJ/RimL family protein N-acetyltransferase
MPASAAAPLTQSGRDIQEKEPTMGTHMRTARSRLHDEDRDGTLRAPAGDRDLVDVDVIGADGTLVHIRNSVDEDEAAVLDLVARASDASLRFRFFTGERASAARYVAGLISDPDPRRVAIVAEQAGRVVGLASLDITRPRVGEIAFIVDDAVQGRGIGTLLLEQLVDLARAQGISVLEADVLVDNAAMVRVFLDSGFHLGFASSAGVVTVTLTISDANLALASIESREGRAEHASMQRMTSPRSVVVIGAGRTPGRVGHEVLRNLLDGGFTGEVSVVNPNADTVLGVATYRSIADVPGPVDLAVVAVPARHVSQVIDECGEAGVRGAVILTSGMGEVGPDAQLEEHALVLRARRHGMRIIGPNCLGILNTDTDVRLNATFGDLRATPGPLAVGSQSGAVGIALLADAARAGLGISEFVSLGNKADVSGNDLLLHWSADPRTKVIALYLESLGNPRKFGVLTRIIRKTTPILVLKGGRSRSGQRAGLSHSAAAMSSTTAVDTLFAEAGVLRMESSAAMVDAARVFADCPPMAGPRLAILGNAGGAGVLAADVADLCQLQVPDLSEATKQALRDQAGAVAVDNPIDLGAGAGPDRVEAATRVLLDSGEIDAMVTIFVATRAGDVRSSLDAVAHAVSDAPVPVAAAFLGASPGPAAIPVAGGHRIPILDSAEDAVRALGRAWEYASYRPRQQPHADLPAGVDPAAVSTIIDEFLRVHPAGGWVGTEDASRILNLYGIPTPATAYAHSAEAAVVAAQRIGYPVVLKTGDPDVVHKTDVGGVLLGLAADADVVAGYGSVTADSANPAVTVQAQASPGIELCVGIVSDPRFGPMITVGAGGTLTDLLADRRWGFAPLAGLDAEQMLDELRFAPLLHGYRGAAPVDIPAAADAVSRVAALADSNRRIAELDINPLVVAADGALALDVKMRIEAREVDARAGTYSRRLG